MKKLIVLLLVCFATHSLYAQKQFNSATGQDILKLFPLKVKNKDYKKTNDRVKEAKGFIGTVVHRDYGDNNQSVRVEVINNSPSLINVNNFLDKPTSTNTNQYLVTTILGYKALVQTLTGETGKVDYEILIPLSATLLTIRSHGYSRDDLIAIANTIPVDKIAKKVGL